MTRINAAIKPESLCDQHLRAEYRELGRVSTQLERALAAGRRLRIPSSFTLGEGHQTFFVDKGLYLERRFDHIVREMSRRNMRTTYTSLRIDPWIKKPDYFNEWDDSPAFQAMAERISFAIDRMVREPTYAGKKIDRLTAKAAILENKPLSLYP